MSSFVVEGTIWHARLTKARHAFEYPIYFFDLDIDRMEELRQRVSFFGLNRWNILSLDEKSYLEPTGGCLRKKAEKLLINQGVTEKPAEIRLVTQLRYFGWVFNPVSFFFCKDTHGKLIAVIADVNNTFNEGHAYVLTDFLLKKPDCYESRTEKVFHVSPFFERRGEYRFEFDFSQADQVNIVLDYYAEGSLQLTSAWKGIRKPFERRTARSILCRYPFAGWLTVFRIHCQAVILHFFKKLPIFSRPEPKSSMTIRRRK